MDARLKPLFDAGPVVRSDHPQMIAQFDYALSKREIVAPFPGVYLLAAAASSHALRVKALLLADPGMILTHASAAHAHGWEPAPDAVVAASTRRPRPGYTLVRRQIPPAFVARSGGVPRTSRAWTALDLARAGRGPTALDDALRRRVPLADLHAALAASPHVPGNEQLRRWLADSRTQPWSPAERAGHEALTRHGVRGWVANHRVIVDADTAFDLDIAFRSLRLAIEIDGLTHHEGRGAFERDRRRDVALARLGWQVVRFPASWVLRSPASFADAVAGVLAARARDGFRPVRTSRPIRKL